MDRSSSRGAALIDVVAACSVITIVLAMSVPSLQATRDRGEARLAARYLAQRLQMVRVQAVRRNRMVAMRFDPEEVGRFEVFVDGDGDGVLQRDIDGRVDVGLETAARLGDYFAGAALRVAATVPSPDGGGVIAADSDPVRIGGTNLLSFSPLGTATSGTVYLAGRSGPQFCVRILGTTGRVRVMWFDPAGGVWRQD